MLSVLLHDQPTLCPWRKRLPERLGSDHYLVNVIAFGALERAEIETHARRRDAREHHVSMAPGAGRALDLNVDVVGQGTGFWHDASLKEAGARHSQSPVMCLAEAAVMGASIARRVPVRCSVLINFWQMMGVAQHELSAVVGILGNLASRLTSGACLFSQRSTHDCRQRAEASQLF
jgi:hypothetical protein